MPQVVIYYTLNDWLKHAMGYDSYGAAATPLAGNQSRHGDRFSRHDLTPPFCGAIARFVSQTTIAPLELVRTKMQSQKLAYADVWRITGSAIRQVRICEVVGVVEVMGGYGGL